MEITLNILGFKNSMKTMGLGTLFTQDLGSYWKDRMWVSSAGTLRPPQLMESLKFTKSKNKTYWKKFLLEFGILDEKCLWIISSLSNNKNIHKGFIHIFIRQSYNKLKRIIHQIWEFILCVSRRGLKRSAYWAYLSINCSTTEKSSLFLFFISSSLFLKMGSWNISLAVLLEIYSHFLYFFWRAAICRTSTFFLIFARTLSVSRSWVSSSSLLYSSLCCSKAWAMLSRSDSFLARVLSASCKFFIIFPSFSLALWRDFFSWIDVSGCFFTLSGSFLTAARYFSSISSFLFTALRI